MDVKYSSWTAYEQQLAEIGLHEGSVPKINEHCVFKGNKRYRYVEFFSSNDAERPKTIRTAIFDGMETRIRIGKVLTIQEPESTFASRNLFLHLLKWPSTGSEVAFAEKNPGKSDFVPEMLSDNSQWKIIENAERSETIHCTVLRNDERRITLWLSPEMSFSLVKHEQEWPSEVRRRTVAQFSSFKEVLPNVFLPLEAVVTNHHLATESGKTVIGKSIVEFKVNEISVNSVPDSAFVIEPIRSEIVVDNKRGVNYTHVPTGDGKLFENIQRAQAISHDDHSKSQIQRMLGTTFIVFVLVTALLLIRSKFQNGSSAGE
jgi:hypothetical protein